MSNEDKQAEVEALNLHPSQQKVLVAVLADYPELTVAEAHEHLKEMGL